MIIRNMQKKDYIRVREIMKELHDIHVKNRPDLYLDLEEPYVLEKYEEDINSENVLSILAEDKDEILGICLVSFREKTCMVNKRTAYMDALCVTEKHRGQGIGTILFRHALELAKEKGAERLDLMVWGFNKSALDFYSKMNMKIQRSILELQL